MNSQAPLSPREGTLICCLCDEFHTEMTHYICANCNRCYGGDCIEDNRDTLLNPMYHEEEFFCGDESSGCYIPEEEVRNVFGFDSDPAFYIHFDCCGKHAFLTSDKLGEAICSRCETMSSCEDCRPPRRIVEARGRFFLLPPLCQSCTAQEPYQPPPLLQQQQDNNDNHLP